jgi:hypothetical protein
MSENEVDNFIKNLKTEWQKKTCKELVKRIREIKPKFNEYIKWKNPYFENNGAVLKFFVAKNWIDIFFYRGYELIEFQDMFRTDDNNKMRGIKIEREDSFNYDRFEKMLKKAVELNQK